MRLDEHVDELMAEHSVARDRLDTIPGVGKRAAETIIAEIGADMSVFPTAGHLASWARMCPGNNITGGKRKSGTTGGGNRWLREYSWNAHGQLPANGIAIWRHSFGAWPDGSGRRKPPWRSGTRSW